MLANCIQAVAVVIIMILCFIEAGKNDATMHNKCREYPIVMEHKHGE